MQNDQYDQMAQIPPDNRQPYQDPRNQFQNPGSGQSNQSLLFGALAGFLVGALLTAIGFTVFNQFLSPTVAQNNTADGTGKGVVTKEDLEKYANVAARDCAEEDPAYSGLELAATKYATKSVSLEKQTVTMTRELYDGSSEDISIQWKVMPTVVDRDCKPITFADIQEGDFLNLYVSKENRYIDSGTELYQRTGK